MPYTEKQMHFFQAVEHGFKPDHFKSSLTPATAGKLYHEGQDLPRKPAVKKKPATHAFLKGAGF